MNHPDWPAFVAAIVAEPDEDTPRLVAADFLEENGDPVRAAFIRLQVDLAQLETFGTGWTLRAEELRRKERAFLGPRSESALFWAAEECPELVRAVPTRPGSLHVEGAERVTWRRGFVEAVRCPAAEWLRHGAAVRARNPVRSVWLDRCDRPSRDAWYAGLDTLRGLRRVELSEDSPLNTTEFGAWLGEWLPGTEVRWVIPF